MRRIFFLVLAIVCAASVAGSLTPVRAQSAGPQSWRSRIAELKAKIAAHPDPELTFSLAMVYAHEGLLIDGWHAMKRVDQMIGGEPHRAALARRIIEDATADIRRNPPDLLARYSLAFASWVAGDHDTAFREFTEITRQDPLGAMNHGYLGYIYSTRRDARNTIAEWETAVRLDPGNSVLHYMLGSAYYRTGRARDAQAQFSLAYRDRTLYNYITRGEEP